MYSLSRLTEQQVEATDVTLVDLHVGRCVVVLVNTREAALAQPERHGEQDGRPTGLVVRTCRVTRVVRVKLASLRRQLTQNV